MHDFLSMFLLAPARTDFSAPRYYYYYYGSADTRTHTPMSAKERKSVWRRESRPWTEASAKVEEKEEKFSSSSPFLAIDAFIFLSGQEWLAWHKSNGVSSRIDQQSIRDALALFNSWRVQLSI